ncbi:MAG: hypothetical protein L0287_12645 [Anaerolineae bacterium]|nr:hypothetical protein [Anaerolineae bacterium]
MKERDQTLVLIGLIMIFVVGALFFLMVGNSRGMYEGANVIGDTAGDTIEDLTSGELAVGVWVNSQRVTPNQHSIAEHGNDAWLATNCYNDHGTFMIMANRDGDFYFPCREEDGKTVRLTVWSREGTSNIFHMKSAYTPKGGNWAEIFKWLRDLHKATKASVPNDITLVIDGVIP